MSAVSFSEVQRVTHPMLEGWTFHLTAWPADGSKCERCWRYTHDVGQDRAYPSVCDRCAKALAAIDFPPYGEASA